MTDDAALLTARLDDLISLSAKSGTERFSKFLSESESAIASAYLKRTARSRFGCFGGHDGAERLIFGISPDGGPPDTSLYPVAGITAAWKDPRPLSHRDILGGLISIGIRRDRIGDIAVDPDGKRAALFIHIDTLAAVLRDFDKAGGNALTVREGISDDFPLLPRLSEESTTVSSLRLDCIVSALLKESRGHSAELIESGLIFVNGAEALKITQNITKGDKISARGFGKYKIDDCSEFSKKGKVKLKYSKYI